MLKLLLRTHSQPQQSVYGLFPHSLSYGMRDLTEVMDTINSLYGINKLSINDRIIC